MEIGAQLFTARDYCKDLNGLAETLKRVADMGYRTVQISGTCAYEPTWLRDRLKENGLRCVLTHIPQERLLKETEQVIRDHEVFDCRYIGLGIYDFGWGDFSEDKYETFGREFRPVMKKIAASGRKFMYHNHDHEFVRVGKQTLLERLAADYTPEEMGFTLDTYWIQAGGGSPVEYVEKMAGRIPCIHLKDYAYGRKMAVIGEGNLNWERILAKAELGGTEYALVEQDDCNGEDPMVCLKRSHDYLRSLGL